MGKDDEPTTSGRSVRTHRPSNFVPRWVKAIGIAPGLFVLAGFLVTYFPILESGARTCQRCGAVESGTSVAGLWLASRDPKSPGCALFERLAGPCAEHDYRRTGCWSSWSRVACTMDPTGGSPAFESCAQAGGAIAERLAARLAKRSARERDAVYFRTLGAGQIDVGSVEGAERWVAAVIEAESWHDLEVP